MRLFSYLQPIPLLLCLALAAPLTAAPPEKLQPEDFATLRHVGDPQLSPDGELVAYTVRTTDLANDKESTNLWIAQWDGSENRALTFGAANQWHPRWSPDGQWLAFLSNRGDNDGASQLWLLRRAGGEAEKITATKGGVEDFAWAPDSHRLVLVVRDPDPRDVAGHENDKKTVPPLVIDRYQFKQDMVGYLVDRYAHLALLDLGTRRLEPLTAGKHDNVLPAWSPDGRSVAFVTKRGADPDRTDNWDVYVIAAQSGAAERQVTTSPQADSNPSWDSAPAWAPDGQSIAYLHGGDPKKIGFAANSLAVIPAAGGTARVLTAALDRNLGQPHWAPDGQSLFALLEDDGAITLVRLALADGKPEPVVGGRRAVAAFSAAPNGRTVVLTSTPDRPFEIFAAEHGTLRPLSKQNDSWVAAHRLARVEETKFQSADGTEIHGFLVLPVDPLPAGVKPPALLWLHGGPAAQYASEFSFEAQLFAAHGYTVILPNPRGSTGRGTAFAMGIHHAWGSVDVQDDLAAVDDAVARGFADPDRLGVGGWSYGGMSTNYLIASTTRFKAATSGASISNILAGYGTDQYIRDYDQELGLPWENPEVWTSISYPFFHADRIKTPTLFLCGQNDFDVPLLNSEQMYQALRALNVPTQLIIYPAQSHNLTTPSYILDCSQRYLAWFAKWIPGPAK